MTGEPNLEALQLGYANARTLQDKLGVPAIVFGVIQAGVLFAIYRAIVRKEAVRAGRPGEAAKAQQIPAQAQAAE